MKYWNIPPCGACATCRDARGEKWDNSRDGARGVRPGARAGGLRGNAPGSSPVCRVPRETRRSFGRSSGGINNVTGDHTTVTVEGQNPVHDAFCPAQRGTSCGSCDHMSSGFRLEPYAQASIRQRFLAAPRELTARAPQMTGLGDHHGHRNRPRYVRAGPETEPWEIFLGRRCTRYLWRSMGEQTGKKTARNTGSATKSAGVKRGLPRNGVELFSKTYLIF